ncbi:MAG: hypothetical protein M5U30_10180 [Burkholderiaceae bacterium]|nr:hypothetical protein [Burkholderiaceae bacterium]
MTQPDPFDVEILEAYEAGKLKSVASRTEIARLKAAARATAIKDRRVNIRLSAGDLQDIQVRALAEGMPYQTLIASILHKYVAGRLGGAQTRWRGACAKGQDSCSSLDAQRCLTRRSDDRRQSGRLRLRPGLTP